MSLGAIVMSYSWPMRLTTFDVILLHSWLPGRAVKTDDSRPEGPGFDPPTGNIIFAVAICLMDVG